VPIEIRELVIRAVVGDDESRQAEPGRSAEATEDLVETCVQEVLRVLKRSRER